MIVATMANTNVQSNAYPYPAPATLAVVTVPGPINAAATSSPGPRFLSLRTILVMLPFPSVCYQTYSSGKLGSPRIKIAYCAVPAN